MLEDDAISTASTAETDAVPPLTRDNSVSSSSESAQTDMASSVLGDGYVLDSNDGLLTIPNRYEPDADLLCPFQILDCDKVFADVVSFKMHVFSHFRGYMLPTSASCFLCDHKFTQQPHDDQAFAWNTMLSHLCRDHYRRGQQLATVRTDFALMRWMYSRRLISDHQFKRTQMMPIPTLLPSSHGLEVTSTPIAPMAPPAAPPALIRAHSSRSVGYQTESFTIHAGFRNERRRLEATRPMMRARSHM